MRYRYPGYPVTDKGGRGVLGLVTLDQVKEAGEETWARTTFEEVMIPRSEVEMAPEEPMTRDEERAPRVGRALATPEGPWLSPRPSEPSGRVHPLDPRT